MNSYEHTEFLEIMSTLHVMCNDVAGIVYEYYTNTDILPIVRNTVHDLYSSYECMTPVFACTMINLDNMHKCTDKSQELRNCINHEHFIVLHSSKHIDKYYSAANQPKCLTSITRYVVFGVLHNVYYMCKFDSTGEYTKHSGDDIYELDCTVYYSTIYEHARKYMPSMLCYNYNIHDTI